MLQWDLLLVVLLQCSISVRLLVAGGTPGDEFLDTLEQQVRSIARQAVVNDAMACALIASCECSSGVCSPLIEDFNNYKCVPQINNTACIANPGSNLQTCDTSRVQLEKGFVRTPTNYTSSSLPIEVRNTICTQRMLDPTFIELLDEIQRKYYIALYFGSVDGSLRAYPGQVTPLDTCGEYDPRVRPWYVGAISVVKDIVVLLDTGPSMGAEWNVSNETVTLLATAENITRNLLNTLTREDRVTIVKYNNDSAVPGRMVFVRVLIELAHQYPVPDGGPNKLDPLYQELLIFLNSTAVTSAGGKGQSNVTRALNLALPVFNSSGSDTFKIIALFTDGSSPANIGELLPVIEELKRKQIFLFVYQLGNMDDTLNGIACAAGGYSEELRPTVVHNPLYALNSYFSFLAQARPSNPFWQPVYTDYDTLGRIITVAYPAISSKGQLVGVAGLDVQVAWLDAILQQQVEISLITRSNSSVVNSSARIERCSPTYERLEDCGSDNATPICARTDQLHDFKSLVCCEDCGGLPIKKAPSSSSRTIVIASSIAGSVAAVALVVGILICAKRYWRPAVYFRPAPKPPLEFVGDGIPATRMHSGPGVQPSDVRL